MINAAISAQLELPAADQIGFVVNDLEQAIAQYQPIFGEFSRMDASVTAADYRGSPADAELKLAFAQSGQLQIELIQWVSGDSPHKEFIDKAQQGMHHIRFNVGQTIDEKITQAKAIGYHCIWYKRMNANIAFAYLERDNDPLIIELLQLQ